MPTVAVVGEQFERLAKAVIRSQAKKNFPMALVTETLEEKNEEQLHAMADEYFPQILAHLGILEPISRG